MSDPLFLDTCALLWLAEGSSRLGRKVRSIIDSSPRVLVSAISAWEIRLKCSKGELELPMDAEVWFPSVLAEHDLELVPLEIETLMAANRLPWHHRDPADRFIIASAIAEKALIVTGDRRFLEYPVEVLHC